MTTLLLNYNMYNIIWRVGMKRPFNVDPVISTPTLHINE
jgi:hypothetical protein